MKNYVIAIVMVVLTCGIWFGKFHRTRECVVTNVSHDELIVTVQHPNGITYDCNVDCTENISEGEIVRVVFDEMTDWEKNYRIKEIRQ